MYVYYLVAEKLETHTHSVKCAGHRSEIGKAYYALNDLVYDPEWEGFTLFSLWARKVGSVFVRHLWTIDKHGDHDWQLIQDRTFNTDHDCEAAINLYIRPMPQ